MNELEKLLECLTLDELTKLFERVESIIFAFSANKKDELDSVYRRLASEISKRKKMDSGKNTDNFEITEDFGKNNSLMEEKVNGDEFNSHKKL